MPLGQLSTAVLIILLSKPVFFFFLLFSSLLRGILACSNAAKLSSALDDLKSCSVY